MILALDLDETLVRVACQGVHNRILDHVDFSISVNVGSKDFPQVYECAVAKRPGLDEFFQWIRERREAGLIEGPWIFTTATPAFCKAMLKQLDPHGSLIGLRVLARSFCEHPKLPGFFLKDLSRIPPTEKLDFRRKVLVDNSPISHVLNPRNAVLVRDYVANNANCTELARVTRMLDGVIEHHHAESTDEDAGDYASYLAKVPGHDAFHQRLLDLGEKLDEEPPNEVTELRAAMRAASVMCQAMKKELLGGAP